MRIAASLVWLLILGLSLVACPPKDHRIEITPQGAGIMIAACTVAGDKNICSIGHARPVIQKPVQARLLLLQADARKVRDQSECMVLFGCQVDDPGGPKCLAEGLNQALDGAMPEGLTYDDLEDPGDAQLVLALYQSADAGDSETPRCRVDDLFACGGLADPLEAGGDDGDDRYDITCGSCEGGPRGSIGVDNGPCPREIGPGGEDLNCFLKVCRDLLIENDI